MKKYIEIILKNVIAGIITLDRNGKIITINGRELTFEDDETILEVARRNGIEIPTLCHLKGTQPTGACRICVVEVEGARTHNDAQKVAEAVANSALVKSSWNGNDPNWGRIIHAVGYSRAMVREELIDIHINGKAACLGGLQAKTNMKTLRNIVVKDAFTITINLNLGKAKYKVYSSDLSPEYIDFNRSEYAYWKQARKDGFVE